MILGRFQMALDAMYLYRSTKLLQRREYHKLEKNHFNGTHGTVWFLWIGIMERFITSIDNELLAYFVLLKKLNLVLY